MSHARRRVTSDHQPNHDDADLEDYRWLTGSEAAVWLQRAAAHLDEASDPTGAAASLNSTFRKDLPAARARLIVEQTTLRRRARKKFSTADETFFTRRALEQATDEVLARYKAQRYSSESLITDLCCGIGGDLLALAQRGEVRGVDKEPVMALLATANASTTGAKTQTNIRCTELADVISTIEGPWHLDPDRRPSGGRTIRIEDHQPGREEIESLLKAAPTGAIKLAPAATPPAAWQSEAELEWISRNGECKQLVAWFGQLSRGPARRVATVVRGNVGEPSVAVRTVVAQAGDEEQQPNVADKVGQYLYEPDAAVLAAGLNATLAEILDLQAVSHESVYLTGGTVHHDAAVAGFEVIEVLPFRKKPLKQFLRQHGFGRIEIKKRGVRLDANQLQRELNVSGDEPATVLVTQMGKRVIAIVARRIDPGGDNHLPQ